MLVVEVDSLPIDKSFSGPDTGNAHGVVLECQPGIAFGKMPPSPGSSRMAMAL